MAEALRLLSGTGLDYAALLFIRVSGLILSSPIFGRQNIPSNIKISYCLALTYFFYMAVPPQFSPAAVDSVPAYVMFAISELLLGLVMGYILTMFFSAAYVAGHLIDMQLGFSMANLYDPQSNASVPLMGSVINVLMMVVFFSVGGHQQLISIMYLAILRIPVGAVTFSIELATTIGELFSTAFLLGVQMAIPIIASGLVAEAILGMIIRTVPQMNVFSVGLPLKVIIGFAVLMMVLPVYSYFSAGLFDTMFAGIEEAFAILGGV